MHTGPTPFQLEGTQSEVPTKAIIICIGVRTTVKMDQKRWPGSVILMGQQYRGLCVILQGQHAVVPTGTR